MECRKCNEKGFSMVYALVMLLVVSIGGTALLSIIRKDRGVASGYAAMRVTSEAAEAALKACEGQFMNNPETALAILRKFTKDNDYRWICNSSAANANSEMRC